MKNEKERRSPAGAIAIIFSAAGYGTLPLFGKHCLGLGMDVPSLVFFRFLAASVCFFALALGTKSKLRMTFPSAIRLLLLGAGPYTFATGFYLAAVQFVPTSIAVTLIFLYPLWVTLMTACLTRESLSLKVMLPVMAAVAGVGLMTGWSDGAINLVGVGFGLLAGLCFASYITLSKPLTIGLASTVSSFYVCLGAAAASLLGAVSLAHVAFPLREAMGPLAGLVFLSTVAPILTFLFGIRSVAAPRAAILSAFEPVVTVSLSVVFLSESMSPEQIGGAALVLGSIFMTKRG